MLKTCSADLTTKTHPRRHRIGNKIKQKQECSGETKCPFDIPNTLRGNIWATYEDVCYSPFHFFATSRRKKRNDVENWRGHCVVGAQQVGVGDPDDDEGHMYKVTMMPGRKMCLLVNLT